MGLLTCAAIFLQHLIPPKVLTLRPNAALVSNLYGHQHSGGQPSAYWVDETQQHFHCDYSPTDPYSCGYTIAFGADPTLGIDLTGYEALQLKIRYQGEAPRIRIFMRNYNPHFDRSPDPGISSKFMSVSIRAADLHEPVLVKMNEFSVGEWWIRDFDVPRIHSAPEFTNVTSLGIDFIFHGSNEVRVESVALVGARIKRKRFTWRLLLCGFCWWPGRAFAKFIICIGIPSRPLNALIVCYMIIKILKLKNRNFCSIHDGYINGYSESSWCAAMLGKIIPCRISLFTSGCVVIGCGLF